MQSGKILLNRIESARQMTLQRRSILVSFHRAITQGRTPQYGAENALHDWEICLAVRESARLGNTWVTLPLGGPTELEMPDRGGICQTLWTRSD